MREIFERGMQLVEGERCPGWVKDGVGEGSESVSAVIECPTKFLWIECASISFECWTHRRRLPSEIAFFERI